MHVFKYEYENGVKLYSPLKCGHRWLQDQTNWISETQLHHYEITPDNTDGNSFFIFRNPLEHFQSALFTETLSRIHSDIMINIISNMPHWSNTLYKDLYTNFEDKPIKLRFIELHNLKPFFESTMRAKDIRFNENDYNFSNSKQNPLGLSKDAVNELYKTNYKEKYQECVLDATIDKTYMLKLVIPNLAPIKTLVYGNVI